MKEKIKFKRWLGQNLEHRQKPNMSSTHLITHHAVPRAHDAPSIKEIVLSQP